MSFATKNVGIDKHTGHFFEGREIVLAKQRGPSLKQERHNVAWWPEEKRIEAATLFAVTKSFKQVSSLSGVGIAVLRKWQTEPWWDNVIRRVTKEENDEIDAAFTAIVKKASEVVLDRLNEGDYVITRDGTQVRKPVDLKSAAIGAAILFDKRQLLRGEATSRTETISESSRLEELAKRFEATARIGQPHHPQEIADVEFIEIKNETEEGRIRDTDTGLQPDSPERIKTEQV